MLLELLVVIGATGLGSYLYHRRELKNEKDSLTEDLNEQHRLEIIDLEKEGKQRTARSLLRSKQVLKGQGVEQLVPHMKDFPYAANDMRALGSPVDYIVFDGSVLEDVQKVVIVEIKSGNSRLSKKQRQIRDCVERGDVEWLEFRVPTEKIELNHMEELAETDECYCPECVA